MATDRRTLQRTFQPALRLSLVSFACLTLAGCLSPAARREQQRPEVMPGGRETESAERRTAAARPKPWVEEKGPFDADRTGVEPYRAQRQTAEHKHRGALSTQECVRLEERYACPLLAHKWQARDVAGGIELTVAAKRAQADQVRDLVRCHDAYARQGKGDGCLTQLMPVTITGGYDGKSMRLRLVTERGDRVDDLRQRVRELIAEAL